MLSGLPLAYNKDLQEDKEYLFDAIDTVDLLLPAMAGMIASARFRADRMAAAVRAGSWRRRTSPTTWSVRAGLSVARTRPSAGWCAPGRARARAGGRDPRRTRGRRPRGRRDPALTAEAPSRPRRRQGGTARAAVAEQLAEARARVAAW